MSKVWLQAQVVIRVSEGGRPKDYYPGDWFQTGKHHARQLIAAGDAVIPKVSTRLEVQGFERCGVVVRSEQEVSLESFDNLAEHLRFEYGPPAVPFDYTLIWKPPAVISKQAAEMGLARLQDFDGEEGGEPWAMLAMLTAENAIAAYTGSRAERDKTERMIGDLRLPVYATDLLWVRRTEATVRVIEVWADELMERADEQHAFLRALYGQPVMMCTLPPNWCEKYARWR